MCLLVCIQVYACNHYECSRLCVTVCVFEGGNRRICLIKRQRNEIVKEENFFVNNIRPLVLLQKKRKKKKAQLNSHALSDPTRTDFCTQLTPAPSSLIPVNSCILNASNGL